MHHFSSEPSSSPHSRNNFSLGATQLQSTPSKHLSKTQRFWRGSLFLVGALLLGGIFIFLVLGARLTQSLQFENKPISFFEGIRLIGQGLFSGNTSLKGESSGKINILLLGRAGEHHPGRELTDTIMLLSLDMKEKRVALLSLPRDLLAPIPGTDQVTKLNTLYEYGLSRGENADLVRESVTEITGLPIHYFASIDFDGFEQVIDALGSVTIEVERDINDTRYPGANYSYETFTLKKGWQKLDGKTVLKYVRERHADPEGDFGRAKRQQQVMQAVREKAWSLPTFLNPVTFTELINNLGKSVTTDITPAVAHRLLQLTESFDTRHIATAVVDAWKKDSLLRVTHVDTGKGMAFALVPRSGTWDEVQRLATNIFAVDNSKERQTHIEQEAATLLILSAPSTLDTAEALQSDIEDSFSLKNILVRSLPALEKEKGTAIIQITPQSTSIYTLDTLISRYNLKRVDVLPLVLPTTLPPADLTLIYTRESVPGLHYETPPTTEENDFQEPFTPLPRPAL